MQGMEPVAGNKLKNESTGKDVRIYRTLCFAAAILAFVFGFVTYTNNFSANFSVRSIFNINSASSIVQHHEVVDIPISQNVYQYRLSSSSGTNIPWRLNRDDFFISPQGIGKEQKRG